MDIVYKEEAYKIIGAGFEVYNEKGFGFHEPVYQECMELELGFQSIPFIPQKELSLEYKGHALKQKYIPDILCFGKIVRRILPPISSMTSCASGPVSFNTDTKIINRIFLPQCHLAIMIW